MVDRLRGKVAAVIGAGSVGPGWGNGKATAVLFAREGAHVFAVDKSPAAVGETRAVIAGEGGDCTAHVADVTSAAAVGALVQACIATYGRIDVLHNNVGIADDKDVVETSEETWDRVNAVNLKSMFLTCKHAIPHMERHGGGSIINISSISAIRWNGRPFIAYYATKAAILGLTRAVAMDHARKGIRCNAILPGMMNTPLMLEPARERMSEGELAAWLAARDRAVPMGRAGTGWDVARAALFLASDDSAYVTGTHLIVDGGLTCKFG